ncbi:hypothetical protein [Pelagibacterium limicola]|uniref:hypothetical protein n=1 Tax=Pelagibacterium limicola TaxID=2791022 RepID=UPI001A9BBBB1|nr:hypothetical protein [Pelagibacterium limicola]
MEQLPNNIRVGMDVFDADNRHIGSVEDFKFGEAGAAPTPPPNQYRAKSLVENIAEAIWPDDMPESHRARLYQEGYVLLDADGIMQSDRYVLPSQIASASEQGIFLRVRRDELAKA